MNTTNTAQYAAEAAKSSCLFAFVTNDMAAEKSKVKTTKTPTALMVELSSPTDVSLYIATTGNTNSTKMMIVMMMTNGMEKKNK